ncbi:uncharacterized protein LOC142319271 [Lycorma delicatula]|uniref:uncharacterized protein LOC142319271 n=1 Tax=Lycorma delicatula TaxID=130591 RepID=UPI003F515044
MADTGDDLLDGEGLLGDTEDFGDLDGDAEDALLADDSSYSDPYHLRTVPTSGRDVYIESDHNSSGDNARSSAAATIYHEVEDLVEGDEIIDDEEEDVLELGVTDEFESELQDHPHNSAAPVWIKQERIDKDVSSLAVSNRVESLHRVDNRNTSSTTVKQEPQDVDTTGEVGVSIQQLNVIVTSSTEVLPQQKYIKNHDVRAAESDDDDNDDEQRDRFKTERTNVISLKNNSANKWGEIPDSLDGIVTQRFNQQQQQRGGITTPRGAVSRRGRQQHPQSHKIHVNPHFKKSLQHPQQVPPSPWENQVQQVQQSPYDPSLVHHNTQSQHYGPPPPQVQTQPPPGPPQIYHQPTLPPHESLHSQPHLPQQQPPPPAPWVRNEGLPPPAQVHFDPQYSGVHHAQTQLSGPHQQYYHQPPPANNVMYPQQPPYEQNMMQHHPQPQPHHQQPPYEYQQQPQQQHLAQPPPPGVDDSSVVQCTPVRTVQFSHDSQQITVQMTDGRELPSHYNNNRQQFNNNIPPPHPHPHLRPQNNWINRGIVPLLGATAPPPIQHQPPQQSGVRFVHPGQRLPVTPQPLLQHAQAPRGQHPRFMRGVNFRRGIMNRHPHPRQIHPQQTKPAFTGESPHITQNIGSTGDASTFGQPSSNIMKRLGEIHQPPAIPFKQPRFNNLKTGSIQQQQQLQQHQRKGPVMSNLCEIPTVDNVPDTTTKTIEQTYEDEDEETRQYRLKIAEQKRLREKLLQQKEVRRQLAAVKKQHEMQQKRLNELPSQQYNNNNNSTINNIPTTTVVQQNQQNPQRQSVHKRIGTKAIVPLQQNNVIQNSSITGYKIVRVRAKDGSILIKKVPVNKDGQFIIQQRPGQNQIQQQQQQFNQQPQMQRQQQQQYQLQAGQYCVPTLNRRIVVDDTSPHKQALAKGTFHAARKKAMKKNMTPITTIVPTKPAVQGMTLGQRFSMQASQQQQQQQQHDKGGIGNQQQQTVTRSNRKVISSGVGGNYNGANLKVTAVPPGPVSHTVVVDNVTASTSKEQLTKMARQVGEVEKVDLEPQLKRATIKFKNTSSASSFYLKFQRKMVDLSMISISMVPE